MLGRPKAEPSIHGFFFACKVMDARLKGGHDE
jgi:hypothetical protein